MVDPGIVCFQHCGSKIFCLILPINCPLCKRDLHEESKFQLLPFRLPYPFIKPYQHPCSIILKPTTGDFLNDYFNSTDLHIGVTTSTGVIVEFDRCGLRKTFDKGMKSPWAQSLLVDKVPDAWMEHWDEILLSMCNQKVWTSVQYHEDTNNCYTFVLSFLQTLNYGVLSKTAFNRTLFCEKYIVPRTTAAGKYISLYRKIRDNGHYVHPVDNGRILGNGVGVVVGGIGGMGGLSGVGVVGGGSVGNSNVGGVNKLKSIRE